jgi:hypothetical protein
MEYYLAVRMRRYGRSFQPAETGTRTTDRGPSRSNGHLASSPSPVAAGVGATISTVRPVSRTASREPGRY